MLTAVSLLEQKCLVKEKELLELESSKCEYRKEFTEVLAERNFFEQELVKVADRLKFVECELERVQQSSSEQNTQYCDILSIRSMTVGQNTIEYAIRNLVDDSKRYSQEMVSYRDRLHQVEKDRDEERLLLN